MIETQIAQIAAAIPIDNKETIRGQPETPLETMKMVIL